MRIGRVPKRPALRNLARMPRGEGHAIRSWETTPPAASVPLCWERNAHHRAWARASGTASRHTHTLQGVVSAPRAPSRVRWPEGYLRCAPGPDLSGAYIGAGGYLSPAPEASPRVLISDGSCSSCRCPLATSVRKGKAGRLIADLVLIGGRGESGIIHQRSNVPSQACRNPTGPPRAKTCRWSTIGTPLAEHGVPSQSPILHRSRSLGQKRSFLFFLFFYQGKDVCKCVSVCRQTRVLVCIQTCEFAADNFPSGSLQRRKRRPRVDSTCYSAVPKGLHGRNIAQTS
ncbi:hypothetical protein EDB81DRAFT_23468 [Dactylonectria macrodidyma]|uniref:Uncharacterized protein n=1 Tax=Dactylonectria macrodidyma TaxID=307937 RepID=A0A9P9JMK6_9HYPO|nr:hypothetical protein EDB81DRAFT_23468 [Dactylonectria macrodidyma]